MPDFPAIIGSTVVTQLPYTEVDEWNTSVSDLECGKSYAWPEHELVRRRFLLNYDVIQRADVKLLEDFFDEMQGELGEFNFKDDQGVIWAHTRFDQDALNIEYVAPNHYRTKIKLSAEVN